MWDIAAIRGHQSWRFVKGLCPSTEKAEQDITDLLAALDVAVGALKKVETGTLNCGLLAMNAAYMTNIARQALAQIKMENDGGD